MPEQIPDSLKEYFQPKATPTPGPEQVPDSLKEYVSAPQVASSHPEFADDVSPLSPIERAAFGSVGRGQDGTKQQEDYLESKFGKGNVQRVKMDENNAGYVVKDSENKWHQVDPHGLSDIPLDLLKGNVKEAYNRLNNFNLNNTLGGAAQFVGERGAPMLGAAMAAAPAAAAGAAGLAPYGAPLGPPGVAAMGTIGGILGAIGGGAAGGAAGSLVDAGTRKASAMIQDATGEKIPGANSYDKAGDLGQQVMGDMLFGASQEAAGPFLKAAGKGVGDGALALFGKALDTAGYSPATRQAIAQTIRSFGGLQPAFARAWADDPMAVKDLIPIAKSDAENGTSTIRSMQKDALNDAIDQAQAKMRGPLAAQYEAIKSQAAGKEFFPLQPLKSTGQNPITDGVKSLQNEGYIDKDLNLATDTEDKMTRDISGSNGAALNTFLKGFKTLDNRGPEGASSYQDLNVLRQNLDNHLYGENPPSDDNLTRILTGIRQGISNVQSEGLNEVDPNLAQRLADLNSKYGPAKDLLGDLGKIQDSDKKVDTFLSKLHKDNGNYAKDMMDSLSNVLGTDNPTKDIVQLETARQSFPWFTNPGEKMKLGPVTLPTRSLTRGIMNRLAGPLDNMGAEPDPQIAASVTDALKKVHSVYNALPSTVRNTVMSTPKIISGLGDMVAGAPMQEQTDKSKILQSAGAFQQSLQPGMGGGQ
jgi:hypothetical protein